MASAIEIAAVAGLAGIGIVGAMMLDRNRSERGRARRKNPTTKFEKCVRAVKKSSKERGYPLKSAEGVCAAVGRRKFGKAKFAAMGRAGKKKAAVSKSGKRRISHTRVRLAA